MRCLAHSVNKPFEVEGGVIEVNELLSKIKEIVTFFKHSVVAADDRRKEQQEEQSTLKLIQSVSTRWNSIYYQLERFLKLSTKVASVLIKHTRAPTMLTAYQMDIVGELINIYKPIERFTKSLSGENYSSGSLVIPLVDCLRVGIEQIVPETYEGDKVKAQLITEINERYKSIEQNSLLSISTILDPRFKKIHFQNPLCCANAITKLKELLSIVESHDSGIGTLNNAVIEDSLWNYHTQLVARNNSSDVFNNGGDDTKSAELRAYLLKPLLDINANIPQF